MIRLFSYSHIQSLYTVAITAKELAWVNTLQAAWDRRHRRIPLA